MKRAPMAAEELKRRIASMERELEFATLCNEQIINREGNLQDTIATVAKIVQA